VGESGGADSAVHDEHARRFIRGGATFAVAGALQRATPLLLLPIVAQVLTPTEFGEIGVILAVTTALATILGLGLETAIFRGYRLQDGPGSREFVNTLGTFGIAVPLALATVAGVLAGPLMAPIVGVSAEALTIGCLSAGLTVASTLVPLTILRAQERLRDYLWLGIAQVISTAGLTLLLVVGLGLGVTGWMVATALAGASTLAFGLVVMGHRWSADFDRGALKRALAFGIPLVPHAFAQWALAVSDRAIMGAIVGPEPVGVYFAAFQICLPVTLVAIAISQGTQPLFADLAVSRSRPADVSRAATSHALFVFLAAAVIVLIGPSAVLLLLPASYGGAAGLIPWLALGACLFGLYLMPMNAISITAGRTRYAWTVTAVAALANVALNLLLVPRFGALAAAINTVVGYAILLIGMQVYARRICRPPLQYERRRLLVGAVLTGGAATLGFFIAPIGGGELLLRTAIAAGLVVALLAVGPLRHEARAGLSVIGPHQTGVAP
jgi:O-antigen/teichoic acid export membrane protein